MEIRSISHEKANEYLASIGMQIGNWNEIVDLKKNSNVNVGWKNYPAPRNSRELFNFSYHVAGWLPTGSWKIVQIDNSNYLDAVQAQFVERLLFGPNNTTTLSNCGTLLFEFENCANDNNNTELLISNLIYLFLLFECHAYFVSSNCLFGEYLAIQDGYAYFIANEKGICGAEILLNAFSQNPLLPPQWIAPIIIEEQERVMQADD